MNCDEALHELKKAFSIKKSTFLCPDPEKVIITEKQFQVIENEINRLRMIESILDQENQEYKTLIYQLESESSESKEKIRKLKKGIPMPSD